MLDCIQPCQRTTEIYFMRLLAVALLTISQFTAFPFIAIVAANTARQTEATQLMRQADLPHNVTTVYKTAERIAPRGTQG